jgi:hypothetical protein
VHHAENVLRGSLLVDAEYNDVIVAVHSECALGNQHIRLQGIWRKTLVDFLFFLRDRID